MERLITLDEVASYGNLLIAHANAKRKRSKFKAVVRVEDNKEVLLMDLVKLLRSGEYRTSEYTFKVISDSGKERVIAKLPYYPYRIVHWAFMMYLEPEFMKRYSSRSHASIKGRGIHSALYQVREMLLRYPEKTKYCFKMDVKKFFWNIDHDILKERLRRYPLDESCLFYLDELIDSFPRMDSVISGITVSRDRGVPIGNYPSQFLANDFLTDLDKLLERLGILHCRYMDDIVVFADTSENAHKYRNIIFDILRYELRLDVKDNWQVFPVAVRGVDLVGYRIYPDRVLYRKSDFLRFRRKMGKAYKHALQYGKISSLDEARINSYAGWLKYCTPKVRRKLYYTYIDPVLAFGSWRDRMKIKRIIGVE